MAAAAQPTVLGAAFSPRGSTGSSSTASPRSLSPQSPCCSPCNGDSSTAVTPLEWWNEPFELSANDDAAPVAWQCWVRVVFALVCAALAGSTICSVLTDSPDVFSISGLLAGLLTTFLAVPGNAACPALWKRTLAGLGIIGVACFSAALVWHCRTAWYAFAAVPPTAIVASCCYVLPHEPSRYTREVVGCILLIFGAAALNAIVRSADEQCGDYPSPVDPSVAIVAQAFAWGSEPVLYVWCNGWIWWLLYKRVRELERTIGEDLGTTNYVRVLKVTIAVAFCGVPCQILEIQPGVAIVALLLVFTCITCACIAARVLVAPLPGLREEAERTTGGANDHAVWAARWLRCEIGVVFATAISTVFNIAVIFLLLVGMEPAVSWAAAALDLIVNAIALAFLSGVGSGCRVCKRRLQANFASRHSIRLSCTDANQEFMQKAEDMAMRGITLEQLLDFSVSLMSNNHPGIDYHFDPRRATTNEVVRCVIIPLSRRGLDGCSFPNSSLATRLNGGHPRFPQTMVSHHWQNLFTHLVAAVFADGLGRATYHDVAEMICRGQLEEIRIKLAACDALTNSCWICAFAVDQHSAICADFGPRPSDPKERQVWEARRRHVVTGHVYPLCTCGQDKFCHDAFEACEMNKFDAMMVFLHRSHGLRHVIAADANFEMFSRAWVVAELVKGREEGICQVLMAHSSKSIDLAYRDLRDLDVSRCRASRQEDAEAILNSIVDVVAFNETLRHIVFSADGLLASWMSGASRLAKIGRIVARTS